jgi:hypothetical protein
MKQKRCSFDICVGYQFRAMITNAKVERTACHLGREPPLLEAFWERYLPLLFEMSLFLYLRLPFLIVEVDVEVGRDGEGGEV